MLGVSVMLYLSIRIFVNRFVEAFCSTFGKPVSWALILDVLEFRLF